MITFALVELLDSVWPGRTPPARLRDPGAALALARANQVHAILARRYPELFAAEADRTRRAARALQQSLAESTRLLRRHGIDPVLIKAASGGDPGHGDFDLVVGDALPAAVAELRGWGVHAVRHPLEPGKVLVYPRTGCAAHLHRQVSWWGIPCIDGDLLRSRARDTGGWLAPDPVDDLRIWVAHALFQNLAVDLSELLALRPLLEHTAIDRAAADCRREGWAAGFRRTVATVRAAVADLDRGRARQVPVMLPPVASFALAGHARHLLRHGHAGAAAWEALLRPPLVLAKARRVHLTRQGR